MFLLVVNINGMHRYFRHPDLKKIKFLKEEEKYINVLSKRAYQADDLLEIKNIIEILKTFDESITPCANKRWVQDRILEIENLFINKYKKTKESKEEIVYDYVDKNEKIIFVDICNFNDSCN